MKKGKLHSICISPERGQLKTEVEQARLIENYGIENDGHAGEWGRQVTCLNWASGQKLIKLITFSWSGAFPMNLLIEKWNLGTVLKRRT